MKINTFDVPTFYAERSKIEQNSLNIKTIRLHLVTKFGNVIRKRIQISENMPISISAVICLE